MSLWPWGGAKGDTGAGGLGGDPWWMLGPAGPVLVLAAVWFLGLWPAVLPRRAHCIQSQTPHYRRDAAKLEAVQRRAGRAVWGGGGLALVLAAGGGGRGGGGESPGEVEAFGSAGPSRKPEKL